MKKIVVVLASIVACISSVHAEPYTEGAFQQIENTILPPELKETAILTEQGIQVDSSNALDNISTSLLNFDATDKDMATVKASLFQTLVYMNAIKNNQKVTKNLRPSNGLYMLSFLLEDIKNFKDFINNITGMDETVQYIPYNDISITDSPAHRLKMFRNWFNLTSPTQKNSLSLSQLLDLEIQECETMIKKITPPASLDRPMTQEDQLNYELGLSMNAECTELKILKAYLLNNAEETFVEELENAKKCVYQLKHYNDKKISTLRKIAPLLIAAAIGGAGYLAYQNSNYLKEMGTVFMNAGAEKSVEFKDWAIKALASRDVGGQTTEWASKGMNLADQGVEIAGSLWDETKLGVSSAASAALDKVPNMPSMPNINLSKLSMTDLASKAANGLANAGITRAKDAILGVNIDPYALLDAVKANPGTSAGIAAGGTALGYGTYKAGKKLYKTVFPEKYVLTVKINGVEKGTMKTDNAKEAVSFLQQFYAEPYRLTKNSLDKINVFMTTILTTADYPSKIHDTLNLGATPTDEEYMKTLSTDYGVAQSDRTPQSINTTGKQTNSLLSNLRWN